MKHFMLVGIIIASLMVSAITVTNAACIPAATVGDDIIVCTGTIPGGIDGDDGNDTITNEGTLTGNISGDILGGDGNDTLINNGIVGDEMRGGNGNDTLINNNYVDDDLQGDAGNDTLINNGYIEDDMRGDAGNDTLINNGYVDDEMRGGDGDDTLINNNYVDDDLEGDAGNDTLINNGYVDDEMHGDAGNDTLINNGIVDDKMFGGDGDDVIINNGFVSSNIFAGSGDDLVIIGNNSSVAGIILGGNGYDILEFSSASICIGAEGAGEFLEAYLTITGLSPASDSVTLGENTYTWVEFEELITGEIWMSFCDGRHEIFDTGTPLVSYCNIFNGLDIYDVNEIGVDGRSTEGLLTIRTTQSEAGDAVRLAISTGQNQLIASDEYGNQLWALSSNELQIMGPENADPSKTYIFILPSSVCGIN